MKQRSLMGPWMVLGLAMLAPACARKAPPPAHPLDRSYGFRDAHFGMAPTMIPGLDLKKPVFKVPAGLDYVVYRRSNENLRIRDVSLDDIRYAFFNKQLTEITLLWDPKERQDPSTPPPIYNMLTNQFGPPLKEDVNAQRREFNATWETMMVRLTLMEVRGTGTNEWNKGRGFVAIVSKPLAAQRTAAAMRPDGRMAPGF